MFLKVIAAKITTDGSNWYLYILLSYFLNIYHKSFYSYHVMCAPRWWYKIAMVPYVGYMFFQPYPHGGATQQYRPACQAATVPQ